MKTLLAVAWSFIMSAVASAQIADREVTIDGGKAPLHGSLMAPAVLRPGPAVLLISGSGPTDRNGNSTIPQVHPATMKLIAEGLAQQGIVSLRFDKRGVGDSAPAMSAEADLRFTTYVDDAVSWARFLASQPRVTCVVLAGHSEGALIATIAAERVPVCGLALLSGAGRTARALIAEQLARASESDRAGALSALNDLAAGKPVFNPPLPALFRPSVQPYLMSWLPIDPVKELAKFSGPVLIVQGVNDLQVSLADAQALDSGSKRATLLLLQGVNHVLKTAPADPEANLATYADPNLPLDPRVVPALVDLTKRAHR